MKPFSVLIPYRENGSEQRNRIYGWVLERWQQLFPEAEICVGSGPEGSFNRGAARNEAYRGSSHDLLVIADADTTVPSRELFRAILERLEGKHTWIAPNRYYNCTEEWTSNALKLPEAIHLREPTIWEHRLEKSPGGILILPREGFEAVGGYDEGFVGWGYEDDAFMFAVDTLFAPHRRMGCCLHLWHERQSNVEGFDQPNIRYNRERFGSYVKAMHHPVRMRQVVGER